MPASKTAAWRAGIQSHELFSSKGLSMILGMKPVEIIFVTCVTVFKKIKI